MAKADYDPEPWERQEEESDKAFEAFRIYRDMGAERSIRVVAKQLGKSNGLLERWSRSHGWVSRCAAYDTEQDRIMRLQQQKDIAKMRKNHANIASAMLLKAAKALQKIPEDEIRAQDISRMVEVASKLERVSRGDVGEVIEERDGGQAVPAVQFYIPNNSRDVEGE